MSVNKRKQIANGQPVPHQRAEGISPANWWPCRCFVGRSAEAEARVELPAASGYEAVGSREQSLVVTAESFGLLD